MGGAIAPPPPPPWLRYWMQLYTSLYYAFMSAAVIVVHIYPPVTGQHQTLTIARSAHFLLQ